MAQLFASWVPGYAAVPELMGNPPLQFPANDIPPPDGAAFTDVNGWRRGFGASFALNQPNWLHIPIPTPVLVEGKRATLSRVMILYRIDLGGTLDRLQVFDGPRMISDRFPGFSGDHSEGLDAENTFDVNHDGVLFGVGISLFFSPNGPARQIYIATAGADFFHNI